MANIMSLKNVRNKASRNGFDLSRRTCFTSKVGELLPVWWQYVLPGDSFNIDLSSFTRTQPVNTASFGRIMEYYDFFFVPLSQLWNRTPTVMTQMLDNNQHATGLQSDAKLDGVLPHFSSIREFNLYSTQLAANETYKNNMFGFSRSKLSAKLMSYLGYGQINSGGQELVLENYTSSGAPNVSIFPLLAYQKIYADFFRFTQWESPNPSTYNVDWMTGNGDTGLTAAQFTDYSNNTMFDLRYCNFQKDLFHGVMPNAQFGDTAAVPVGSGSLSLQTETVNAYTDLVFQQANLFGQPMNYEMTQVDGRYAVTSPTNDSPFVPVTTANGSASSKQPVLSSVSLSGGDVSSLSILALRQAEALQRWKEVAQAAEEDYKQQIQAHWGVNVSDYLSGMCRYLGGNSNNVQISEVVNTNLVSAGTDQPADLAGKGIGSQRGNITFNSQGEYGVIMCIYHALPLLDYITSGTDAKLLHVQGSSFPIPEMDNIGMELLPSRAFTNNTGVLSSIGSGGINFVGYVPRYIDWKTDYDRCVGAFASSGSKNLQSWILPYSDDSFFGANRSHGDDDNPNVSQGFPTYPFFKVNPSIVDPMFAVDADETVETDPLLNQCFVKCYVTRNLDVNGLPY